MLLGSADAKAPRKTLVKLTPARFWNGSYRSDDLGFSSPFTTLSDDDENPFI
jgi:hypothetical protein